MISSIESTADGFSILAIILARPLIRLRASRTSSARCTKDNAIHSTPCSKPNCRSCLSLSVIAGMGRTTLGTLTPFRSERRPPMTTSVVMRVSDASTILKRNRPSLASKVSPTAATAKISGCGRQTRASSPGALSRSKLKVCPGRSSTFPSLNCATRSFGPCRSSSTPIGRACRASTRLIAANRRACSVWLPWLMFSLKTSAPEIYRLSIRFSDELEGPRVARIFVERFLFIDDNLQVTETLP
ncbi:hypothetical protein AWB83_00989 [Caballeronia ptereochthonis]|uniref:Uncharacterized protein n=1 Tax=Caballeronia ptereochthonis TaxID=1777144 RepID=A0A157ZS72_9BURK|nr:hypothetical protein AWB83_00989 [Caballeronia ptereochthonis]